MIVPKKFPLFKCVVGGKKHWCKKLWEGKGVDTNSNWPFITY